MKLSKSQFLNGVGIVSLTIVGAVTIFFTGLVIREGLGSFTNTEAFVSAFAGAFFTFLLVKFAELGTRLREIERDNLRALITAQHTLSGNMNKIGTNLFVAKNILSSLEKTNDDRRLPINFNSFKPIAQGQSDLKDLRNEAYLNDLYSYYADIEKLNDTMLSIQRFYGLLTQRVLEGQTDQEEFWANAETMTDKLEELSAFLEETFEDTLVLTAKANLLLKHRSNLWRLAIRVRAIEAYPDKLLSELESEHEKLRGQSAQIQKESRAKIQEVISRQRKRP